MPHTPAKQTSTSAPAASASQTTGYATRRMIVQKERMRLCLIAKGGSAGLDNFGAVQVAFVNC